jgi:AcrR family transcriptional regulator
MAPAGRRQGDPRTKETIIDAARAEFLARGYTATTIRAIARRTEVDPALVYHYFADKAAVYAATLDMPGDPRAILNDVRLTATSPGARLVEGFLAQWEGGQGQSGQRFVNLVQAMSSSPEAARSVREFLFERVWDQLSSGDEAARWRTLLVSSQLVGLAWNRYIVRAEPLASAPVPEVARRAGPAMERLMFSDRPEQGPPGGPGPDGPADPPGGP